MPDILFVADPDSCDNAHKIEAEFKRQGLYFVRVNEPRQGGPGVRAQPTFWCRAQDAKRIAQALEQQNEPFEWGFVAGATPANWNPPADSDRPSKPKRRAKPA